MSACINQRIKQNTVKEQGLCRDCVMACYATAHLPDADCRIIERALIRRELTLELHELRIPADCVRTFTGAMRA